MNSTNEKYCIDCLHLKVKNGYASCVKGRISDANGNPKIFKWMYDFKTHKRGKSYFCSTNLYKRGRTMKSLKVCELWE